MEDYHLKKTTATPIYSNEKYVQKILKENYDVLKGTPQDWDKILQAVGNAEVVMIGEASHGTEEFYKIRAEITKRLIVEKGFTFIGVEGDWPDVYRIHRFVCGKGDDTAEGALGDFERFPKWMWRNHVVLDFIKWLRAYNDRLPDEQKVGFYGLDMYSMFKSIEVVVDYLDKLDPNEAKRARDRYGTLEKYRDDEFEYAAAVHMKLENSRQPEVIAVLKAMLEKGPSYLKQKGYANGEELFYVTQNSRLVKSAEEYYRNAFFGGASTWNIRDRHMTETVDRLMKFEQQHNGVELPKGVLWAHNSHLGDARATEYKKETGEVNIGQLVRERWGLDRCFNIGFTTYTGTVSAAATWGGNRITFPLTPAFRDSYEALFHNTANGGNFSIILRSNSPDIQPNSDLVRALTFERTERMVGVQYVQQRERSAHYCPALLGKQFDAVIHLDVTSALRPLD